MSGSEHARPTPRCVWLTLDEYALSNDALAQLARKRWQAAPADPTEALRAVLVNGMLFKTFDQNVEDVLRALGSPKEPA